MPSLEEVRDKSDRKLDGLPVKAIEKAIRLLIDGLMAWDETGYWGKGYAAFYTVHIKVLAQLLGTELKYRGAWETMIDTVHAMDKYTAEMKRLRLIVPKPFPTTSKHVESLVDIMDRQLIGNMRVFNMAYRKVKQMNEFLGVTKNYNLFDWIIGSKKTTSARNDACLSVSQFCDEADKLIALRNEWAKQIPKPSVRLNFRRKMGESCPETIF